MTANPRDPHSSSSLVPDSALDDSAPGRVATDACVGDDFQLDRVPRPFSHEAARAAFFEECRALGLDPDTQTITPMMYALAVISARPGGAGRKRKG